MLAIVKALSHWTRFWRANNSRDGFIFWSAVCVMSASTPNANLLRRKNDFYFFRFDVDFWGERKGFSQSYTGKQRWRDRSNDGRTFWLLVCRVCEWISETRTGGTLCSFVRIEPNRVFTRLFSPFEPSIRLLKVFIWLHVNVAPDEWDSSPSAICF